MATAWWSLLVDGVVAVAALVAFLAFIAAAWIALWKTFLNQYGVFRALFGLPPLPNKKHERSQSGRQRRKVN
ncbi:Uncharacterized protein PBTT_03645 [Plasmodiophora brassicae]|uniref:Uncharacterized protein n=1 Tax=Plasmodiophora brassicae TaxID=37360 RepID=A0A0G4IS71_PLABS|nr:hypothetical protein PBRA_006132 [Plasmodiophora brassicae]SPQ96157.1 unnamed protein product [Plasmodiophora brassicae]